MKRVVCGFTVRFGDIGYLLNMTPELKSQWEELQQGARCYCCSLPISADKLVIPCVCKSSKYQINFIHAEEYIDERGIFLIKDCAELQIAVAMLLAKGDRQTKKREVLVA